jgi:uncharacterized protein with PQ loop repeat
MMDAIGHIAATLTTIASIPQASLTWGIPRADGFSVGM